MREIEFRAWIETRNQKYMAIQGEPDLETLGSFMHHYGDEKKLMRFTGLTDKNGVKIYEGDIVKWGMHKDSMEYFHRYAIVKIEPDIAFKIIYYISANTGEKKDTDNHVFHYGRFAYKDTQNHIEVIGNIHENPELLS